MLQQLKQYITQIDHAHGVEISLLPDGELLISAVTVRLKKNKIVKEYELFGVRSIRELAARLDTSLPVSVIFNGKGILYKKIAADIPSGKFFDAALPNANPNEFYLDSVAHAETSAVWLVRKEVLESYLQELLKYKFKILSVSVGARSVEYLLPYLNLERQPGLKSNHYKVYVNEKNQLMDIELMPLNRENGVDRSEYSIGDQYVHPTGLLSFGAALGLIAGGEDGSIGIKHAAVLKEREEYKYARYYKTSLKAFLVFVFVLLFINFLIYNHYFNKDQTLQASHLIRQDELSKARLLKTTVDEKAGFISQYGWDHPVRLSFYADRIAGLLPDNATLTDMKLYPSAAGSLPGGDERMSFKRDTIEITGSCDDPTELSRFTNNLKNIPDFKTVSIKSYSYKKETQTGIFSMEIITF